MMFGDSASDLQQILVLSHPVARNTDKHTKASLPGTPRQVVVTVAKMI